MTFNKYQIFENKVWTSNDLQVLMEAYIYVRAVNTANNNIKKKKAMNHTCALLKSLLFCDQMKLITLSYICIICFEALLTEY